jgi:phosphoglucosamine mutase
LYIYPQTLKNLVVSDKDHVGKHPIVQKAITTSEEELGDNGRVLCRASGTEPLWRVMVEAESLELCNQISDRIINSVRESGLLESMK